MFLDGTELCLKLPRSYLEQLHPDDSEHELEQECDQHDVVDGLHSHNDALDHMLQPYNRIIHNRSNLGRVFTIVAIIEQYAHLQKSNSICNGCHH